MRSTVRFITAWLVVLGSTHHAFSSDRSTALRLQSLNGLATWARGGQPHILPEKCGLPILAAAFRDRHLLSPALQSMLRIASARPVLDASRSVGPFRIHYDTSGANAPAMLDANFQRIPGTVHQYVDSVATILMYTDSIECGVLGYSFPPSDINIGGGPEYDVYVLELGTSLYGLTTLDDDSIREGGRGTTFLELDNDFQFVFPDSNKGIPGLKVTVAHEFHHAIQLGSYGFWSAEAYFYEMTSVWMEDVVFTGVNDYYQYLWYDPTHDRQSQLRHPEIPFTSTGFIEYSRGIWGHFVAKRFGLGAMRAMWEEIRNVPPLRAMDNVLHQEQYSSSFKEAFAEWTRWNFFVGLHADTNLYYPEGEYYPSMFEHPNWFTPPTSLVVDSLRFLSASYYQILGLPDTVTLIQSNVNINAALANGNATYPFDFMLSNRGGDPSYRSPLSGFYYKVDVSDPSNWYTWDVVHNRVGSVAVRASVPFPNPFFVDGSALLRIGSSRAEPTEGTLSIFTSSMDLVFSARMKTTMNLSGQQIYAWNGKTNNGDIVQSGIYFYVLDENGDNIRGKFAAIRK
jgi:hypothetical protein